MAKLNKGTIVLGLLIFALLITVVQGIEINNLGVKLAATSGVNTQKLSPYDQMMYDMHGTLPSSSSSGSNAPVSGIPSQVGGC